MEDIRFRALSGLTSVYRWATSRTLADYALVVSVIVICALALVVVQR